MKAGISASIKEDALSYEFLRHAPPESHQNADCKIGGGGACITSSTLSLYPSLGLGDFI